MSKIDIKRLKQELRETAALCKMGREALVEAQRTKGQPLPVWKAADAREKAAWRMTQLCIFRASLHNRKHITRTHGSTVNDVPKTTTGREIWPERIIERLTEEFALKDA